MTFVATAETMPDEDLINYPNGLYELVSTKSARHDGATTGLLPSHLLGFGVRRFEFRVRVLRGRSPLTIMPRSRAKSPGARLLSWFLLIMLSLGCSVSSAQIEPNAGKWKTWVLTSGDGAAAPAAEQSRACVCDSGVVAQRFHA